MNVCDYCGIEEDVFDGYHLWVYHSRGVGSPVFWERIAINDWLCEECVGKYIQCGDCGDLMPNDIFYGCGYLPEYRLDDYPICPNCYEKQIDGLLLGLAFAGQCG